MKKSYTNILTFQTYSLSTFFYLTIGSVHLSFSLTLRYYLDSLISLDTHHLLAVLMATLKILSGLAVKLRVVQPVTSSNK